MKDPKFYRYTVTGRGYFPVDMLRYDCCWPRRGEDSSLLLVHGDKERTVEMMGVKPPTKDRWRSFVWSVGEVE